LTWLVAVNTVLALPRSLWLGGTKYCQKVQPVYVAHCPAT